MQFEKLKKLVGSKPTFIKFTKVQDLPDGRTQRDTYLLVKSVEKGVHSNGYQDWDYVQADYTVSLELTYLLAEGWKTPEVVGRRVDFHNTLDIVKELPSVTLEEPPKKEVSEITRLVKQRAVEAVARANTWCEVMGEEPLEELKNKKDKV